MIIKSFTTDFTVDETAERLADKRHDVPTEIVTCGRTIEGQIDIRDCRASAVNHLEQPVSTDAAGGSESLIEHHAPAPPAKRTSARSVFFAQALQARHWLVEDLWPAWPVLRAVVVKRSACGP